MADLKAAAERLRCDGWSTQSQDRADRLLAAQALEALAWQEEKGASVRKMRTGGFFCAVNGDEIVNNYYADTPLGALLAAMQGERK